MMKKRQLVALIALCAVLSAWAGKKAEPVQKQPAAASDVEKKHDASKSKDIRHPKARYKTTPEGWFDDYNMARDAAKKSKRAMLILFTGSDWCGWCMKLHDEVLEKKDFKDFARKNLVLVYLDMPRNGLPKEAIQANSQLMRTYGVRGFPSTVLTDSAGKVLTTVSGFRKDYLDFIEETLKSSGSALK